jgi:hypothetical protein
MSEINNLGKKGFVTETINFANQKNLSYTIRLNEKAEIITASFEQNEVIINVPVKDAEEWIKTDKVGIEYNQKIDDEKSLRILLEKDFKCLTRRVGEDDMFPNPIKAHT